ncbi:GntR family transcriptional regulator [Ensifer adhaerens]|uniref:GntR family transcriptional regulator n=1 Tax=Ensifer adhaerens TaxID=106592 RepID=UPI000FD7F5B0|nr:GntR family transcriptional regulator [Ensifer adhaerens]MDF8357560.1 GntR family transcriptional regulator [Ensifer adhaerens]THA61028.1 GntR family transcriptional regulator [Ensifer adhaerens]
MNIEANSNSPTLKQAATDALRELILKGRIRPGEQLRERDVAEMIGVSRTPLREALNQLEREGLVESQPHRGYSVTAIDLKTGQQLLDLRRVLDGYAARLAATAITQQGLDDLDAILAQLAVFEAMEKPSVDDLAEEVRIGLRIHEVIARESGDAFLYETLKVLYGRLTLLIWVDVLWVDKWDDTRADHKEIVFAVEARDPERAAAAAEAHVDRSRADLQRVIDAQTLLHGLNMPPSSRIR